MLSLIGNKYFLSTYFFRKNFIWKKKNYNQYLKVESFLYRQNIVFT